MSERENAPGIFSIRHNLRQLVVRAPGSIPVLDGIRGVALLWTMGFHAIWLATYVFHRTFRIEELPGFARVFTRADLGVDVFFVLSGFLIGRMLLAGPRNGSAIRFGEFYLGRAFRILPVYYFVLAIWAIGGPDLDTIWSNFLFVNNFVPFRHQVLPTAWSLAIEEQFYLVMPLVLTAVLRLNKSRRLLCLAALLMSSFVVRWIVLEASRLPPLELHDYVASPPASMAVVYRYQDVLYDKLHMRFGCLVIGVIGAYLDIFHPALLRRWFSSRFTVPGLAAASALTIGYVLEGGRTVAYSVTYRNATGLVVAAALLTALYSETITARILRAVLSSRVWHPIARLSYPAYLLQLIVIWLYYGALANRAAADLPRLVVVSIAPICVLTFSVSIVVYLLVERPAMNLWQRLRAARRPRGDAHARRSRTLSETCGPA
jgi:peptidoglycan/LPS O-acetylase OafA/YrhL